MNKQQLANRIWASANKMRSKIDANEYKDFILGLIFYKYLCDNEVNYLKKNQWEDEMLPILVAKDETDDEDIIDQIDDILEKRGYYIPYKYLFQNWIRPDSDFSIDQLTAALGDFERSITKNTASIYSGIFDTLRANLTKLGDVGSQTRTIKDLIRLIKDIPTDGAQDYDVLGYVYEYLISNFAANAGKKAGEFYTPHEVASLMSEIVAEHHKDKKTLNIYDPTSGSGSLLITIGKAVSKHTADKDNIRYYAQELKENTYNLTRMNLVMRGISSSNIETRCADSLDEDWPRNEQTSEPLYVDAVVSNPPYSQQWDPSDRDSDPRFKEYGVAPKSKADYAFLLHELHHLKPDGILTIVLPHGVLFRGGEEEQIRRNLIEKNNIDTIIGLPANIFFGTGIPTLVMVLKQHREADNVLIIDASKGFVKDGKQNKLRACDVKKIADCVRDRSSIPGFSRLVEREEIRQNGYNLNIPRYVDSAEQAEHFDIYATMFGGIPDAELLALQPYWDALPSLRDDLFAHEADRPYSSLKTTDIRQTIAQNADVVAFRQKFKNAFDGFEDMLHNLLIEHITEVNEQKAQDIIASDIFRRFEQVPLVDRYAAFQVLADHWTEIVDDIETIQQEGNDAIRQVETAYKLVKKGDEEMEVPDGEKGRIVPFALVQQEQFKTELDAIATHEARLEAIATELDEQRDNLTDDEKALYFEEDKEETLDKKLIKQEVKDATKKDPKTRKEVPGETLAKLKAITALWDEQATERTQMAKERDELLTKTKQAIQTLTDDEAAHYLHQKWIAPVAEAITQTLEAVLADIEAAVATLQKKYATNYCQIDEALTATRAEMQTLVSDLTGDPYAIQGLLNLIK